METFLDEQEQTSNMSIGASNARSQAEGKSFVDLVKDGLDHISGPVGTLAQRVHEQKSSEELAWTKKQLEDATKQNLRLTTDYNALTMKLRNTNEELERVLRDRNAQRRNAGGDALANSRKATDDTIQDKWKQLDYNIRTLAHYLATPSPKLMVESPLNQRFRNLHRSWRKFLQDDDLRELLLECYLWHIVTDRVFDASGNIHGGNLNIQRSLKIGQEEMMGRASKKFQHPASFFQRLARWRAQGSALFDELWNGNEKQLNDVIAAELRLLEPFWVENPGSPNTSEVKTRDEMKGILEGALELDRLLMGSKAIFEVVWEQELWRETDALQYNPYNMEVVASNHPISAHSPVVFFTSPVLYKMGNADGQNYDSFVVLVKASVVCD
ncbi:hypothetical protein AUP68_12809 [Ilyonectria robusta]